MSAVRLRPEQRRVALLIGRLGGVWWEGTPGVAVRSLRALERRGLVRAVRPEHDIVSTGWEHSRAELTTEGARYVRSCGGAVRAPQNGRPNRADRFHRWIFDCWYGRRYGGQDA